MPSGRHSVVAAALTFLCATGPVAAQEAPADAEAIQELPHVVVIETTPVPAPGTAMEQYPGNVQSIPATQTQNQHLLDIPDLLSRNLGSVNVSGSVGNPWENDLTYRGFLASPLTGTPIGLSMYLDGMRFNDGFGETINWDLIPQSAIAGIDVIPGSNPIFGLNTLGGALAVRTKRGVDFPGATLAASGGSFGRWTVRVQSECWGHDGVASDGSAPVAATPWSPRRP
jgi:iron complex outermembrane receptor protein